MKKKPLWAAAGLIAALGLWVAAFLFRNQIPYNIHGTLVGVSSGTLGMCASVLIRGHIERRFTPEQRREIERDERNIAIREKAAQRSWYWTLYLLWGLFVLGFLLGGGPGVALISIAITLHCVFYAVNMRHFSKTM